MDIIIIIIIFVVSIKYFLYSGYKLWPNAYLEKDFYRLRLLIEHVIEEHFYIYSNGLTYLIHMTIHT